jgi:hypothetical protein
MYKIIVNNAKRLITLTNFFDDSLSEDYDYANISDTIIKDKKYIVVLQDPQIIFHNKNILTYIDCLMENVRIKSLYILFYVSAVTINNEIEEKFLSRFQMFLRNINNYGISITLSLTDHYTLLSYLKYCVQNCRIKHLSVSFWHSNYRCDKRFEIIESLSTFEVDTLTMNFYAQTYYECCYTTYKLLIQKISRCRTTIYSYYNLQKQNQIVLPMTDKIKFIDCNIFKIVANQNNLTNDLSNNHFDKISTIMLSNCNIMCDILFDKPVCNVLHFTKCKFSGSLNITTTSLCELIIYDCDFVCGPNISTQKTIKKILCDNNRLNTYDYNIYLDYPELLQNVNHLGWYIDAHNKISRLSKITTDNKKIESVELILDATYINAPDFTYSCIIDLLKKSAIVTLTINSNTIIPFLDKIPSHVKEIYIDDNKKVDWKCINSFVGGLTNTNFSVIDTKIIFDVDNLEKLLETKLSATLTKLYINIKSDTCDNFANALEKFARTNKNLLHFTFF